MREIPTAIAQTSAQASPTGLPSAPITSAAAIAAAVCEEGKDHASGSSSRATRSGEALVGRGRAITRLTRYPDADAVPAVNATARSAAPPVLPTANPTNAIARYEAASALR